MRIYWLDCCISSWRWGGTLRNEEKSQCGGSMIYAIWGKVMGYAAEHRLTQMGEVIRASWRQAYVKAKLS